MKKVTLAIAMAALVMFAGCKKDKETTGTVLKASIEQNTSDRTSLHPNGTSAEILWTSGDKILVNNGTSNATFTLNEGAGTKNGTFNYAGEYTFGASNVAVYPETATISGNTVSLTLPETQTFTAAGTFGNGANPMLGTFTDPNELIFTSLCGVLGVSLTGDLDITGIEIVSNNTNDKLNGLFEADCTAANPVLAPATGNSGSNSIMLNCAVTLSDEAQVFYFVLPVGTLANGFTMNVYYGGSEPFSKSTESTALAVEWNTVKVMSTVEVTTGGGQQVPTGAIGGWFTINANGDQVYFSQGNLQYQASTNTWQFAEHQWDYVGTQTPDIYGYFGGTVSGSDNSNISSTYSGWIDLFVWGTSGYNHGANCYQPWSTSTSSGDYFAYGNSAKNLYDVDGKADWGYNAINNGGNTENSGWRTLTNAEWSYVFSTRSTTSGIRWTRATVNGVNGTILLPDNWTASIYALNNPNDGSYFSNTITAADWTNTLEANGAVFLPAAGKRNLTTVNYASSNGFYWSSSHSYSYSAYFMNFDSDDFEVSYTGRSNGYSVRLVRNAE